MKPSSFFAGLVLGLLAGSLITFACIRGASQPRPEDVAWAHRARPRTTDPHRVVGAKPAAFAWWLFELLGALPGDDFHDLFPGSGGIARAWTIYNEPSHRTCATPAVEA